ncbi:N-6 DNA methylase [Mesorhizobium sp. M0323]|uniref:Eco57I restriction-modification methylase domain-containing protein n=1 Tax=Mesorhizobium sp. M0323 TaxID=2956938 RepID=UPI00333C85BF
MTAYDSYSEQDTVDTLILPHLSKSHGFPKAESLDYQAQHTLPIAVGVTGRYDGLYLAGGYPYAVLEAKRYSHDLTAMDEVQGIDYATSAFFDKPVPFVVISNGREHRFFKTTGAVDPSTGRAGYARIPATDWAKIKEEPPGEVRQLLTEKQLLDTLRTFKQNTYNDVASLFIDPITHKIDPDRHVLGESLKRIVNQRKTYVGDTTSKSASKEVKVQQALTQAIEGIALHFTIKILFIKLIEDLARGAENPRVIHTLFPQVGYDHVGGLFGYKVLNALSPAETRKALRLYSTAKSYYKSLAQQIAKVTWQDIFRYGFNVHMGRYGQLFKAKDYDRFLPAEETLAEIRGRLIEIDVRTAVIYGSAVKRSNVIGDIYERLIDDELRSGLGAIYTPDVTMTFMVDLSERFLNGFRGKKIVEPACGSGHFYREVYRRYVNEVFAASDAAHQERNPATAHAEALEHVYGRDIDPFAVQLTLLSTFLEQLKDNVGAVEGETKLWLADRSVDTQNSLDPVTVDPDADFGLEQTADLSGARTRRASAKRALLPDLIIGNPPYGVDVVKGPRYDTIYDLQSNDSYGYFIVNALERLKPGKRVIFIVSSSFLTIGSHRKLRETILRSSKVIRVLKLHRATFPGIDIFPIIIELERCDEPAQRKNNHYQFYDLWRLHPETHKADLTKAYAAILADLSAQHPFPFDGTLAKRYTVRQGLLSKYGQVPIFEGRPSLYEFMANESATAVEVTLVRNDGANMKVKAEPLRGRKVVKLRKIAEIKIGLQSGNNPKFYRSAPGVKGGAAKGGYQTVSLNQVVDEARLSTMTKSERENGFQVDDKSSDKFFVPLDKAGASDIEGGLLPLFWRPHEFFVNWSEESVSEMKTLHGKGGVFRNPQYYFRRGISFSNTGIYSPTFRLGHGGVFDQTGSNIFCDVLDQRLLLGILCSTAIRYFEKSFINHGVHAQLEELPIVLPTDDEAEKITTIVDEIIQGQQKDLSFDYRKHLGRLDDVVNDLYGLNDDECKELESWYHRHYPKLTGEGDEEA